MEQSTHPRRCQLALVPLESENSLLASERVPCFLSNATQRTRSKPLPTIPTPALHTEEQSEKKGWPEKLLIPSQGLPWVLHRRRHPLPDLTEKLSGDTSRSPLNAPCNENASLVARRFPHKH